jgi:uncharacterized protein YndB with AHSA1/START domain
MSEPLILRARAAAELDAVRRALTDPAELREWFAESVDVELPHRFAFWGRYTPEGDAPHQRLVHVDDHSLRFDWRLDGIDTTTEINLDPESASSTIVTISQTDFDFSGGVGGTHEPRHAPDVLGACVGQPGRPCGGSADHAPL